MPAVVIPKASAERGAETAHGRDGVVAGIDREEPAALIATRAAHEARERGARLA